MNITIGFKTDSGRQRESNQDSYAVLRRPELDNMMDALLVVADGMGGGRGGGMASSIVAQALPELIHEFLAERNKERSIDVPSLLSDMIVRANHRVWMRQAERPEYRGMGTTCVAAIVQDGLLTVGNAGDSRAYLLREGQLHQLTQDHSVVWQEVVAGNMTRDEARTSRYRNSITKAVGLKAEVTPDVDTHTLEDGDTVLLCSDGLNIEVGDEQIARVLASAPDAQTACDRLVQTALRNGGSDNVTVIVLRYGTFTPLALPEERLAPDDLIPESEPDTDPSQDWRKTSPRNGERATPSAARADDIPDFREPTFRLPNEQDEDEEERAALGGGGLARSLLVLLLVLAIAETIGIVILSKNRTVVLPTTGNTLIKPDDINPDSPSRRPPKSKLIYGDVEDVYKGQPLRDAPLRLDPDGNAIVVTKEGQLVKINSKGQPTPYPTILGPTVADSGSAQSNKKSKNKTVYITFDDEGNRYQTDPTNKVVVKFDSSDTRINPKIAEGMLTAPGDIAVTRSGDIYIIDDHKLKRIISSMTPEDSDRMHGGGTPLPGANE